MRTTAVRAASCKRMSCSSSTSTLKDTTNGTGADEELTPVVARAWPKSDRPSANAYACASRISLVLCT
eukprot:2161961-Amphidinium_carterae.1